MFVWPQTSFAEVKCSGAPMGRKAFQLTSHSSINLLLLHFFALLLLGAAQCACDSCRALMMCCSRSFSSAPRSSSAATLAELPSLAAVGQSKGTEETEGLLKFKWHSCCEGIFYLFWHLHCQQEWQSAHHSPPFCRAEACGNLKGFSWGIQSKRAAEFDGITANVNEQAGQGLPRESLKDTKTASLLMSSRCPSLGNFVACGEGQARLYFGPARREWALEKATRSLIFTETCGSKDQKLNSQH